MSIYFLDFDIAAGRINDLFYPKELFDLFRSAVHEHAGLMFIFSAAYSSGELRPFLLEQTNLKDFVDRVQIICRDNIQQGQTLNSAKKRLLMEFRSNSNQFHFFDNDFSWVEPSNNELKVDRYYRVPQGPDGKPSSPLYLKNPLRILPYNPKFIKDVTSWMSYPGVSDTEVQAYYQDYNDAANKSCLIAPTVATLFGIGGAVAGVILAINILVNSSTEAIIGASLGMGILFGMANALIGAFFGVSLRDSIAKCSAPKPFALSDQDLSASDDESATDSDIDVENGQPLMAMR